MGAALKLPVPKVPSIFDLPIPANDNFKAPLPTVNHRFIGWLARLHIVFGAALLAYSIYELYQWYMAQQGKEWENIGSCPQTNNYGPGKYGWADIGLFGLNNCTTSVPTSYLTTKPVTDQTLYRTDFWRYNLSNFWMRPNNVEQRLPVPLPPLYRPLIEIEPLEIPRYLPSIMPQADPWRGPAPGTDPGIAPVPVPYPSAPYLPEFSPMGEPIRGPSANAPVNLPTSPTVLVPAIEPIAWPFPGVADAPLLRPPPLEQPEKRPCPKLVCDPLARELELTPTRARTRFRPTRIGPPGPRVKERKIQPASKQVNAVIWWALNQATEMCDAVGAIYSAIPVTTRRLYERKLARYGSFKNWQRYQDAQQRLPEWLREKSEGLTCQAKAGLAYRHINEIDVAQALINLATEQASDEVFGRVSKGTNPLGGSLGRGPTIGPAL